MDWNSRTLRLAVLLALLGVLLWWRADQRARRSRTGEPPTPSGPPVSAEMDPAELAARVTALDRQETAVAETLWAPEMEAQRHGLLIDELWQALNQTEDDISVLGTLEFEVIRLPTTGNEEAAPLGIRRFRPGGSQTLEAAGWRRWLEARRQEGWRLAAIEFRHIAFDPSTNGLPARSRFLLRLHAMRSGPPEQRALVTGVMAVTWAVPPEPEAPPRIKRVDLSAIQWALREGRPPFRPWLEARLEPPPRSFFTDPLLVRDMDGDGRPKVIMASANTLFRLRAKGWVREHWLPDGPGLIFTALIEDFDADGHLDLLTARFGGLYLFRGKPAGGFQPEAEQVWTAEPRLRYAQALTCGDVDHDGDLDVWLGQYKGPYTGGQMPTPWYDANDGHPSWLLLNDGHGRFQDATAERGLAAKRFRRTYGASFADLDLDGDLDLLVVSDFAGVDLYLNDGRGFFRDVTTERIDERHGFGMAHLISDFNRDGLPEVLVTGMHCPTAWRLNHLGLTRAPDPDLEMRMRRLMTEGCRLYYGTPEGRWRQLPTGADLALAGWSWGCAAPDVQNDGFPDVYIANGHETRQVATDYEPYFWLHDIHVADSHEDPAKDAWFASKFSRTRGRGMSYGGYEKNRLYLNLAGGGFLEAGWLLGVAVEEDSRNVVGADLDGDGRQDLVVTTFEAWPENRQTIRIFRNETSPTGHWLAVALYQTSPEENPVGAVVSLQRSEGVDRRWIVTGDSHRSQQPPVAHFGLGGETEVKRVQVRYTSGRTLRLEAPALDRLYRLPISTRSTSGEGTGGG